MAKKNGLTRRVRGSYAISTVSIALVLFLMSAVGYFVWTLSQATESLKERMTLFVTVAESATEGDILDLGDRLTKTEGVREVVYVSKEEAAEDYREYAGGDWQEFLDYNPLPDTYEVRLAASESTKALVESLTKEIGGWREVDDVVYQKGMVESMEENLATFRMVLLIFGSLLLFVSVVLLRNTIRMSVYSRREIISTMKLVGANKGFIRRPFLINSVWMGVAAGALASLFFFGALVGISKGMPYLMLSYGWQTLAVSFGAIVVCGVIISFLFTLLALNRFINMNSAKTNIY